jgi:hypothetical protein
LLNVNDEWVKYSTAFSNDIITYARCLLDKQALDQLGRALPEDAQRDTSILITDETEEETKQVRQERNRDFVKENSQRLSAT